MISEGLHIPQAIGVSSNQGSGCNIGCNRMSPKGPGREWSELIHIACGVLRENNLYERRGRASLGLSSGNESWQVASWLGLFLSLVACWLGLSVPVCLCSHVPGGQLDGTEWTCVPLLFESLVATVLDMSGLGVLYLVWGTCMHLFHTLWPYVFVWKPIWNVISCPIDTSNCLACFLPSWHPDHFNWQCQGLPTFTHLPCS